MGNNFMFTGEVISADGAKIPGRSGKIITFTAERLVNTAKPAGRSRSVKQQPLVASWGASLASTLEAITLNDLGKNLKSGWSLVLAVPTARELGNGFKFIPTETLPRFSINIFEAGREIGGLDFIGLKIGRHINQILSDSMTLGVRGGFSMLSVDEVPCTFETVMPR